jgi:transposase InsO family protein
VLENLALRHQLQVALRGEPQLRIRQSDRILWVWLRRLWPGGWRRHLTFVQPETVIGWHRKGWRLYWTSRSRGRLARPRISAEVRELIGRISRGNPLWGSERIRGELLKLGIVVSNRSIRRYRWRPPTPIGTQRWRTFLTNELQGIWAADLLVVQTVGFRTVYVLFFITHARRELVHFNVTASPTAAWVWQQVINATPWGTRPSHLIHDRDAVYGKEFGEKLERVGIVDLRTPIRAPRANSIAERVVRTFRQECLDHVIVINERHLHKLLTEFVRYYNHDRSHRSLGHETPVARAVIRTGPITSRPVLGGLHHAYARAA